MKVQRVMMTDKARKDGAFVDLQPGNPYYDSDAVRDADMFIGRRHELRMLYNAVEKRQCFSVVGSRHIGKSSLLKFLGSPEIQRLLGHVLTDRIFIRTDWREYPKKTREDFFNLVCEQIILQSRPKLVLQAPSMELSSEDRFKHLLEDINAAGFRPVLLMDAFDKVTRNPHFDPDFFSFMRSLAGIYDLISYVTASMKPLYEVCHSSEVASSPFFNIFQTCVLSALTLEEARELITLPAERAGLPFTSSEVEHILTLAGRHPFYIQVACRKLFDEKLLHLTSPTAAKQVSGLLLQEAIYEELEPHFDQAWEDLSEEQQQNLKLEVAQLPEGRRKLPELSESALFRKHMREIAQVSVSALTIHDLKEVLDHFSDTDALEKSKLVEMHYVVVLKRNSPNTRKGVLVRDFLKAAFECMQGSGMRSDSAPEWRLYNILHYHYFKYHLPNAQTSARLGFGSTRQFYREQEHALQILLKELLGLEQESLDTDPQ